MDWLTDGVAAAIGTIVAAVCSLLVAFVHRRSRTETPAEAPAIVQGQTVDAADPLATYLRARVDELEAEVEAERTAKERYRRQRDAAYGLLRQNHVAVPDPDL